MAMPILFLDEKGPLVGFKMQRRSDALIRKKMALQNMILFNYKVKNDSVNKLISGTWSIYGNFNLLMIFI